MPRTTVSEAVNRTAPRTYRRTALDTGDLLGSGDDNPVVLRHTKTRLTNNTPNFRSLKSRKEGLPMNGFVFSENNISEPYGRQVVTNYADNTQEIVVGRMINVGEDLSNDSSAIDRVSINNQALNNSLKSLKQMKVNLGVAFGERKQTSRLILGTAGRIANALRSLRRGNLAGVAQALGVTQKSVRSTVGKPSGSRFTPSRALAREWLALQYGWKPLLSDVYGAAESLARLSDERRVRITVSKSGRWFKRHTLHDFWNVPATRIEQGRYTRKYVYVFSHSSEVLQDLSAFGVTNPASVAWELLPWSFVFDWFIPLGEYIDTWDATLGLTFQKGCRTTFEKWRVTYRCNGVRVLGGIRYDMLGAASREQVSCERVALSNFPAANLPNLSPYITVNRGASTVALLHQRLKL